MIKLAVIGNPVDHSLSPNIFSFWAKMYDLNITYDKIEVDKENLASELNKLIRLGYRGLNITMPFKHDIVKYVNNHSPIVKRVNCANVITIGNEISADNTDYIAMKEATEILQKCYAVVFGAGGAANSTIFALKDIGFKNIYILNRSYERALNLSKNTSTLSLKLEHADDILSQCNVFINATSLGLGDESLPIDLNKINKRCTIVDLAYKRTDTKLIAAAKSSNFKVIDGIDLLVSQASHSFHRWVGFLPTICDEIKHSIGRS